MGRILLIHFSDIHLGSELLGTKSVVPGLNGHQLLYCEHVEYAFKSPHGLNSVAADFSVTVDDRLCFVLSGDLTRVGSVNDFHLAYEWLLDGWTQVDLMNPPRKVGLGIALGDLHSVPGNHDQWDGETPGLRNRMSPPAYNSGLSPQWFRPTPWRTQIASQDGGFILDLFGVDSNSGLAGESGSRFSEGAISHQQMIELEAHLQTSETDESQASTPYIRCVVCHHSLYDVKIGALRAASAGLLEQMLYQHHVNALLTGHLHLAAHDQYTGPQGEVFWELRAPSATQRTRRPAHLGFWVHELDCTNGYRTWNAWQYSMDANAGGFARHSQAISIL